MSNELKDPFETFRSNKSGYLDDLQFGCGGLLIIGATIAVFGILAYYAISGLQSLFN